jgi:phosphoribosylformimino-5-aminoimidazole carboxamide ribotide isomerase
MFEVIPAIDLRAGRCVRLFQGDFARETIFGDDPVAMARRWAGLGARRLHVVDLDGAKAGAPVQLALVAEIAAAVEVPVELGGGLRTQDDVDRAVDGGVERVVLGTAALTNPDEETAARFRSACLERHGDRVVIGLDARDGRLAVRGWQETTSADAFVFAERLRAEGFGRVIYTDISRDGALSGPNVEHIRRLCAIPGLAVIGSGGVSRIEDLEALAAVGAEGAIVGQALYSGAITLDQALGRLGGGVSGRC